MKFVIESKKDITIFRLQEKRLDAALAPELKSQILMLIEAEGKKYLVIDLAQVDAIDSSGIGALLIAHRQTAVHDGFAAFIGVHGNVKDLLQMMQLHKQLYIFSSVQEVLRNLEEVETDDSEDDDFKPRGKKSKPVDDEEDDIAEIPEIPDVEIPDAEIDLGNDEIETPEFPDNDAPEFPDEDEEKPKKKSKPKKAASSKPAKAAKKPAAKPKAKKK